MEEDASFYFSPVRESLAEEYTFNKPYTLTRKNVKRMENQL